MESESHSFIAGLFVIFLGLLAIGGAIWLGAPKGPARLPIDLLSTHSVAGLQLDAPVRFRGVEVGHVESIAFDARRVGQIRVRIAVDSAAPITRATYAKLSSQGLNGVAIIELDNDRQKSGEPLRLSAKAVPEMELQAGLFERAEEDGRDVLLKAARAAARVEAVLNEQNTQRLMGLVDSLQRTSERFGSLAREFEPSAKALPVLLQQTVRTVERAQTVASSLSRLADDADRKLVVLDTGAAVAAKIGQIADDLHNDTLPRVNALVDEISVDARELKGTLHHASVTPQSFIFGLQETPGPGERGFVATGRADK